MPHNGSHSQAVDTDGERLKTVTEQREQLATLIGRLLAQTLLSRETDFSAVPGDDDAVQIAAHKGSQFLGLGPPSFGNVQHVTAGLAESCAGLGSFTFSNHPQHFVERRLLKFPWLDGRRTGEQFV